MVSLPPRRWEPWRGYALKAPPRRSTGALLADCAWAGPLTCLYRRHAPACQPEMKKCAVHDLLTSAPSEETDITRPPCGRRQVALRHGAALGSGGAGGRRATPAPPWKTADPAPRALRGPIQRCAPRVRGCPPPEPERGSARRMTERGRGRSRQTNSASRFSRARRSASRRIARQCIDRERADMTFFRLQQAGGVLRVVQTRLLRPLEQEPGQRVAPHELVLVADCPARECV